MAGRSRTHRGGPKPRWGDRVQVSSRWPVEHREVYERIAREQGISFNEYLVRFMAAGHNLSNPADDGDLDGSEQLALGA